MTPERPEPALRGVGLLITRPLAQARALAENVRAAGGTPILFAALEIADVDDPTRLNALIARLEEFDMAVFVSRNAVGSAMARINACGGLPEHLKLAVVGPESAGELRRLGAANIIAPSLGFDTDALLGLAQFSDVRAKRIVIFRARGGRELLAQKLAERGAVVEYAECYQRRRPQADPADLLRIWASGTIQAVSVMSGETLQNLAAMLGEKGRKPLQCTPLFVPHPRIAETAGELSVRETIVTGVGDDALLAALEKRFKRCIASPS